VVFVLCGLVGICIALAFVWRASDSGAQICMVTALVLVEFCSLRQW